MNRPTVASLQAEVEELKKNMSNVRLEAGTCWNEEQLLAIVEVYNRYGEMVKLEVTSENLVGKKKYDYQIWHYPLLNEEFEDRHTPKTQPQGLGARI